jgi:Na+-transporting NADH:ubiquinone oxidoreductase subunit F
MAFIDINNGYRRISVSDRGRSLLSILHDNDVFIPSACGGQGACGYCRVKVLKGGGPVTDNEKARLTPQDLEKGLRLSCQIEVDDDIAIEIPAQRFTSRRFSTTVDFKRLLTPTILHLRLSLTTPAEITFIAGQYIQLETKPFGNVPMVSRAYSIASPPSQKNSVELILRRAPNGISTTWAFDHLQEGETVFLTGPYGRFRLTDTDAPVIMIAGGSGMAPIRSVLYDMKDKGLRRPASYFFGMPSEDDLYMVDEIKALETALTDFYFVPVVMQPKQPDAWKGDTGTPIDAVERRFSDLSRHEAYLCGPPGMIDACIKRFGALGMMEGNIFYDKF